MVLSAGRGDSILDTQVLVYRLSIHAVRGRNGRQCITGRLFGEQGKARCLHSFSHRISQLFLSGKQVVEPLSLHDFEDFLKPDDQRYSRRKGGLILRLILSFFLEIEIERGVLRPVSQGPGLIADTHKGHPRWQHQRLLRTGDHDIQSPGVRLNIEYTERRDGINHEDRILMRSHDLAQGFHVVRNAGRGLARLYIDRFNGWILLESLSNQLWIDGMAPFDFDFGRMDTERLANLAPALPKFSAIDAQSLVAW